MVAGIATGTSKVAASKISPIWSRPASRLRLIRCYTPGLNS